MKRLLKLMMTVVSVGGVPVIVLGPIPEASGPDRAPLAEFIERAEAHCGRDGGDGWAVYWVEFGDAPPFGCAARPLGRITPADGARR